MMGQANRSLADCSVSEAPILPAWIGLNTSSINSVNWITRDVYSCLLQLTNLKQITRRLSMALGQVKDMMWNSTRRALPYAMDGWQRRRGTGIRGSFPFSVPLRRPLCWMNTRTTRKEP